ncbi:MAG: PAS domain S-box protein, partial [Pseudomonadota bacterium]
MSPKNILIADDEQAIRCFLTELLKNEGYLVFSATNGKEAVEIAKNNPLDLAILDQNMPEMGGITALKRIKEIDRSIEILVITGYGDLQSLRDVIEQEGVFDYLLKPFGHSAIKDSVKKALKRRELNLKKNFVSADLEHQIREMESDFKQKTIQLRESQLKYKNIIKDSVDMVVIIQAGRIQLVNPKTVELTGYTEDELLDSAFIDTVHPDDRTHVMDRYRRWLRKDKKTPRIYTFRVLKKDGEALWVESNSVWTEWEGASATLNIARDISERKQAVEELRIMEFAISSSINAFVFFDLEGRLTRVNDSFLKLWGYKNKNEVLDKQLATFI